MDANVIIAVTTVTGSVTVAALSYFLTKRQQREAEWRVSKLNHYRTLLSAISGLACESPKAEAHQDFALAFNTIGLVAPQRVIDALVDFHNEVRVSNPGKTRERHDELLVKLILAIRTDLDIRPPDNPDAFRFHLVASPPKKSTSV
jgi:hypothetical protein